MVKYHFIHSTFGSHLHEVSTKDLMLFFTQVEHFLDNYIAWKHQTIKETLTIEKIAEIFKISNLDLAHIPIQNTHVVKYVYTHG